MAKTILTPKQHQFLELASKDKQITKLFYLTGGTALAEFHLHHRLSEDLDFFTYESEVEPNTVEAFLQKISPQLGVKKILRKQFLGLFSFTLAFKNNSKLKVDFNYYPFLRIDKGIKHNLLEIDSIYDIAANKMHTIFMKPRGRDYIDLFFILKKHTLDINKLIINAKIKFDWDIDRVTLASQFIRVKDFQDFPKILIPFEKKEMESFFLKEAKKLEKDIFKN